MPKFNIKKQISKLYACSILGNLSLTGAWVAILSARGFSLAQIGLAEMIFHIISLIFEIPSGVFADVFGRRNMLIVSNITGMIGNVVMIFSHDFPTVCVSMAFNALSYNFASGSGDALAFDSLKTVGRETYFEKYASNQMMIFRVCSGVSTLCAGLALLVGYRVAYGTDLLMHTVQILVLVTMREVRTEEHPDGAQLWRTVGSELLKCFAESIAFLKNARRAIFLMMCNSLVGSVDILLLFFLQAKLPEAGIPQWGLGIALFAAQLGGVVGAKLILKTGRVKYKFVFAASAVMVICGVLAEHSGMYLIMAAGGFISAAGDDALQVKTNAKLQNMFPSEQRATLISFEEFTFSVVMLVLSPLAGVFFSKW